MSHIRQKIIFFKFVDRFVDILCIIGSFYLSIIFESLYHADIIMPSNIQSFNPIALIISIFIFLVIIGYFERHFFYRLSKYKIIFKNVFLICMISFLFVISINFLLKTNLFFRSTIVFFICFSFAFLLFKRILVKLILETIRIEGMDYKNIMIVGYGDRARELINLLDNHKEYGMKISCIIDSNYKNINVDYKKGDFSDMKTFISTLSIDDAFICTDINNIPSSEYILDLFYSYGINIHIMADMAINKYINKYQASPIIENFYGIPSFTYNIVQVSYYKLVLKNIFERIFSVLVILITCPFILLCIFLISITSKGSPLFIQERVGLRGRVFKQYKLRTMVSDAETMKKDLLSKNDNDGPTFKMNKDPRITWIGKFLRKFSIDELPQFFNVLKGDMNLVGPRPYPVSEVNKFEELNYYRRHSMKPGITGLWQIKDRRKIVKFKDSIKLDLEYIDNWSFSIDLYIIFMTLPIIIRGTGK